jgi:hypothetical protein
VTAEKIGEFISIERDGATATVTMDRGDGRNALSRQLILELTEAARSSPTIFRRKPSSSRARVDSPQVQT